MKRLSCIKRSRHLSAGALLLTACVLSFSLPGAAKATVVTMKTTMGNIDIELFDSVAPLTVNNFLNYVQDGDYVNSFIHRSVPGFIIQGGGFQYDGAVIGTVPADAPVVNEFSISNTRGTLAMATLLGDPDSATSQWFINLEDNSSFLDLQNGGYTVFGRVLGDGMQVVDAIAAVPVYDFSSLDPAFGELPLSGYTGTFDPGTQLIQVSDVSVNAIPVPAAFWLFGTGLVSLIGIARNQRS